MNPDSITYLTGAGMVADLFAWFCIALCMVAIAFGLGMWLAQQRKRRVACAAVAMKNWEHVVPMQDCFKCGQKLTTHNGKLTCVPCVGEAMRREGPAESVEQFWERVSPTQYCETPCVICGGRQPHFDAAERAYCDPLREKYLADLKIGIYHELPMQRVEAASEQLPEFTFKTNADGWREYTGQPTAPACGVAQSCNECSTCPDLESK